MEPLTPLYEVFGSNQNDGMADSFEFRIGYDYQTLGGDEVTCIAKTELRGYECAQFSDGGWRYNRPHDRGRCTGSEWTSPGNVIPIKKSASEHLRETFENSVNGVLASVGVTDYNIFAKTSCGSYSRPRTARLWENFVHGTFPYTSRENYTNIHQRYLALMTEAAKLRRKLDQMAERDE